MNESGFVRLFPFSFFKQCQAESASQSKPIIDEIDRVLAQHYGFTDEELDFIIDYDIKYRDIKYRMGRDNGGDD
jgi:hypothetical protein